MEIVYSPKALEDVVSWRKTGNKKALNRISLILDSIEANPYQGIGKPEALKYELTGCWPRRITGEHRIVYRVLGSETVEIISLRFHY